MATVTLTLQDIIDNGNNATLIAKFVQANGKQELSNLVKEDNIEKIKLLLSYSKKADLGINTALVQAAEKNKLEIVKLLLDNGADIHYNNDDALVEASSNGHLEIVKFLVEKDANINTKRGLPLRWACYKEYTEIAKFLLEKGEEVNNHTINDSALRLACNKGNSEIVKILLEKGANVHVDNAKPLKLAIEKCHVEMIKLLLQHGAIVNDDMIIGASHEIKDLFKKTMDVYFGIESDTELEIKLPDLIKITKNNKYYYVYKSTVSGSGFVVPQMDFKIQILSGFGEMKIFNCL